MDRLQDEAGSGDVNFAHQKDSMKALMSKEEADKVAISYSPRRFPATISPTAHAFVNFSAAQNAGAGSSFRIDRLVAQQTGVAELERLSLEEKVEQEALLRLKDLQEQAYEQAYQLGLEEGREKAFLEHQAELEAHMQSFGDLISSVTRMKTDLIASNETQLVSLVFAIAKRLAGAEVSAKPELVLEIVREAIEGAQSEENVTVKVSGGDFALIEALKEKLGKEYDGLKAVRLEASETVTSGGCIVETNYGDVNASVERRVEKLWESFADKLPKVRNVIEVAPEPRHEANTSGEPENE